MVAGVSVTPEEAAYTSQAPGADCPLTQRDIPQTLNMQTFRCLTHSVQTKDKTVKIPSPFFYNLLTMPQFSHSEHKQSVSVYS